MRSLVAQVPRLQQLAVFEAVARLGSFTAAAGELGITQPAVSRQIRRLEDQLATVLFDRTANRPVLTADGVELHTAVDAGFSTVEQALGTLRKGVDALTIAVQPVVAETWFSPHLAEVRELLGTTRLQVVIFDHDDELRTLEHDVSIRFGDGRITGQRTEQLLPEVAVPTASPELAERHGLHAESSPAMLLEAGLLEFDQDGRQWANWHRWFEAATAGEPQIDGPLYRTYGSVVPLAISGNGVILTWRGLRGDLVERGLLVEVGQPLERPELGYHLVWPVALQRDGAFRALRTWLREAAGRHL